MHVFFRQHFISIYNTAAHAIYFSLPCACSFARRTSNQLEPFSPLGTGNDANSPADMARFGLMLDKGRQNKVHRNIPCGPMLDKRQTQQDTRY